MIKSWSHQHFYNRVLVNIMISITKGKNETLQGPLVFLCY
uniref:Uncharacterized protein n=1 Tax=Arundo donax TaxID=35708 RepID=A0A0A9HDN1_ARUDO